MTNKYTPYIQFLADKTEQLETSLTPYYTSLEPYQRGLLLITLTLFLLFAVYSLLKSEKPTTLNPKKEQELEEKLMRQMAFFKRLKE